MRKIKTYIPLSILILLYIAYSPLFSIYFADHDSMHMALRFQAGWDVFSEWVTNMAHNHKRYYYFFLFPFISISYFFKSFLYLKIISLLILLSNLVIFSKTLQYFFRDRLISIIAPFIFLLTQSLTTNHSLFSGYFPIYQFFFNFFCLGLIFFDKYLKEKNNHDLIFFAIFYSSAILLSEIAVILSFLLVIIYIKNYPRTDLKKSFKSNIIVISLILIVNFLYASSHIHARLTTGDSEYMGNQIKMDEVSLTGYIKTVIGFSIFNIPAVHFANKKFQSFYKKVRKETFPKSKKNINKKLYRGILLKQLLPILLIKFFLCIFFYFLFKNTINYSPHSPYTTKEFSLIMLMLILIALAPNSLHAINHHYQSYFIEGKRWATHMSYFSRFAIVALTSICLLQFSKTKVLMHMIIVYLMISTAMTDFNNFHVSRANLRNKFKWDALHELNKRGDLSKVNCIYSKYLFHGFKVPYYTFKSFKKFHLAEIESDTENYWEKYVRIYFNKNIQILGTKKDIFSPTECANLEIKFESFASNPKVKFSYNSVTISNFSL